MQTMYKQVKTYLNILERQRYTVLKSITEVEAFECDYWENTQIPDNSCFSPFNVKSDTWGNGYDAHAWFKFKVTIPEKYAPEDIFLNIITNRDSGWDPNNPQFIAYIDSKMIQGMDIHHRRLYLGSGGEHQIHLYAYTGIHACSAILKVELCVLNRETEKLWYDIKTPMEALNYLPQTGFEYANILKRLHTAIEMLDMYEIPSVAFFDSVHKASEYMTKEFYTKFCSPATGDTPTVVGIGHTHIDCAWLWTLRQTREKVQRSFSTVVALMKKYPEYRFMSSQAFLYQNVKEDAPELYEEIKQLIKQGKWECEGAMWVEADCNLSSGESLVRQIMYGKHFFRQEFGVENKILWLPDVFGYSAALPQILKKSGINWFVTSKISWNDTNKMPYDTFLWKGIDGTCINTYFLTAQNKIRGEAPERYTNYVAHTTAPMVAGTYERYQQKNINNEVIITFGYGDGGGGPTEEHLEMARRLSNGIPGIPDFRIDFAGNVLSSIADKLKDERNVPCWDGELYLEYHRGTLTTQAKNKKTTGEAKSFISIPNGFASLIKY